jgi:hypothetical protein
MEPSLVRRRVVDAIERARRAAKARRTANDAAGHAWDRVRDTIVVPLCQTVVQVLRSEGHPFELTKPGTSVRLVPERSSDDWIEFGLDTHGRDAAVVCAVRHTRGREIVADEREVAAGRPIDSITDEDVLSALVEGLAPFVER